MQENQNQPLDGAEREVEAALASLRPARPGIDRDELMFTAGYRSARFKLWLWRSAAGSLAAMLLLSIFIRPQLPASPSSPSGGQLVRQAEPASQPPLPMERIDNRVLEILWALGNQPDQSPRSQNYLSIRQAVLKSGLSALPAPAGYRSNQQDLPLFELRSGESTDELLLKRKRPEGQEL
jgi:hypothetical protein